MTWEQHFIVEGKFLGSTTRTYTTWTKDAAPPDGYSFCCPSCGSMWATCPVVGRKFHFLTRRCGTCGDGSMYTGWDDDFVSSWPRSLTERELLLAIQELESRL